MIAKDMEPKKPACNCTGACNCETTTWTLQATADAIAHAKMIDSLHVERRPLPKFPSAARQAKRRKRGR